MIKVNLTVLFKKINDTFLLTIPCLSFFNINKTGINTWGLFQLADEQTESNTGLRERRGT